MSKPHIVTPGGNDEEPPTWDAYHAASRGVEKHRERADKAEATLAQLRDHTHSDVTVVHDDDGEPVGMVQPDPHGTDTWTSWRTTPAGWAFINGHGTRDLALAAAADAKAWPGEPRRQPRPAGDAEPTPRRRHE